MGFKPKAELQFETKLAAALKNRDIPLVEQVMHQFGCYLQLVEPLPESYGLPVALCVESDCGFDHVWYDVDNVAHWCGVEPETAADMAAQSNTAEAILARVEAETAKALES